MVNIDGPTSEAADKAKKITGKAQEKVGQLEKKEL
jgi:uncharacterized protein YjbJ (UPF0337 family)